MTTQFALPALAISALALISTLPVAAQEFPLTIETKFGETVIPAKPERVASLDYAGADDLLALGVQPVTIRYWYGDYPRAVWPWAETYLEIAPQVLRGDLNFEQIAAADPDIIIALWSGITDDDYRKLSLIAPVVAVPDGVADYALPWDERALLTGRVIGAEAKAEALVASIRDRLASIEATHPDWTGKTVAIAHAWNGPSDPGVYTSHDVRAQLLEQMGFHTPEAVDALAAGNEFVVRLSPEDLSPIDADLLVWLTTDGWESVFGIVARPFLEATQDGREIFIGPEVTGAFSHASLLSLPFAIERLVPMIEAALDGDPATNADDRPEAVR